MQGYWQNKIFDTITTKKISFPWKSNISKCPNIQFWLLRKLFYDGCAWKFFCFCSVRSWCPKNDENTSHGQPHSSVKYMSSSTYSHWIQNPYSSRTFPWLGNPLNQWYCCILAETFKWHNIRTSVIFREHGRFSLLVMFALDFVWMSFTLSTYSGGSRIIFWGTPVFDECRGEGNIAYHKNFQKNMQNLKYVDPLRVQGVVVKVTLRSIQTYQTHMMLTPRQCLHCTN